MSVWIVEGVSENDGGWLPDSRWIEGVFSSEEKAKEYIGDKDLEITEYEVDD